MENKKLYIFIAFLVLFIFLPSGFLYSAASTPLNSLIEEALSNNPQIQAAKQRYEASKARISLLRTLDDPKFEYEYDKIIAGMDAVMNGNTGPMQTFSISQEVPFPTKLFLRKKAAQKEASSFEQEFKETQLKVIKDLKEGYFRLFLSQKKINLTKDNLDLLSQFVAVANKKYAANKATQQDSLKAQVEYSKLSNQLVLLEQEKKIAQEMLNFVLNRLPGAEVQEAEEASHKMLELDEQRVTSLAKENRPELKSFREMLRKSEIEYSLAKQEYLPDFMLKYKKESGTDAWAGMVGFTFPLWFWDKQNSMVKEARAGIAVAKADYRAQENLVIFEVRSAYAKFDSAKKLVNMFETGILPQAQAALEISLNGYQADKLSFMDLLDSLRSLREFQMEYFEALANLEIDLADLERSSGADFGLQGRKDEK